MELVKWLSIADRYTKMYLDRHFLPLGINSSQHMYLLKVCEQPGITQDQMLECFYVHPSNVTRSIVALAKAGFLRREANPEDKRTCRLYPTERAEAVCQPIRDICTQWQQKLLRAFSTQERQMFLTMLHQTGMQAVEEWGKSERETGTPETEEAQHV